MKCDPSARSANSVLTVGTLLHLSDLHLAGAQATGDVTGDYKIDVVLPHERQRRTGAIKGSLESLGSALLSSDTPLDAIVITGDVTVHGRQDGIELLPQVLAELGKILPSPDRILVVPGNHDVVWGTAPSSEERYAHFVKLRDFGYRTAYLDGVDVDSNGSLTEPEDADTGPCLVALDESFIVVGMSTSDMCGVQTRIEPKVQEVLEELDGLMATQDDRGKAVRHLYSAWQDRGLYDVARLSNIQRKVCYRLARQARQRILDSGGPAPVMIAAFHHQLRPVSDAEEFKPFEGITNLGECREWLAGNDFDLLLHGHKHEERVLEDIFVPFGTGNKSRSHRLLVVSAPTIGHGQPASNPVGRLITVDPAMPRLADIKLTLIPSRRAGIPIALETLPTESYTVGDDDGVRLGLLVGDTAQEIYDKILATQGRLAALPRPLICRFSDGPSALTMPSNYPSFRGTSAPEGETNHSPDMQEWFAATVDWWSRPIRGAAATFNHGERIRGHDISDPSQFASAIRNLRSNDTTSRAVIVLIKPASELNDPMSTFPAFALVQMVIRDGDLTMTGYFRKQEMPHWWPINAAELATLQRHALDELATLGTSLRAGSICTITAMPVSGKSAPRVVIPDIDRRVEDPEEFLELLVPLYYGGASAAEVLTRWHRVIDDWCPTDDYAADGDPVPILGLARLAALIEGCNALASDGTPARSLGVQLAAHVRQLHDTNLIYAAKQGGTDRARQHQRWRADVEVLVSRIFTTVTDMTAASRTSEDND